jgi:hypothetical protein
MEICNGEQPFLTVRDEQDFAACHLVARTMSPAERASP